MSAYIQFGSGKLFMRPTAGNLTANPTPVRALTIQDIKFGQKGSIKELRGENQYPDDTAVSDKTGDFEFGIGRRDFFTINQIFNADIVATGGASVATDVQTTIAATNTMVPPASGTFQHDLGVRLQSNNQQFTKLPSGSPAAGQYTVNEGTGVYTFNAGDAASVALISFSYTLSAIGATYQVNNQPQGYAPQFEAYIVDTYQPLASGVYSVVKLYAAKLAEVSIDNKRDSYGMFQLKGQYFNSPSGRVIDYYSNAG